MKRRNETILNRQLAKRSRPDLIAAPLQLSHVSNVARAMEIIESKRITVNPCRVFKRPLAYFYALRPLYRPKNGNEPSHQISRFPVAFVLSHDAVANPKFVFPFDTGAADDDHFVDQADPNIPLEDYQLEPSENAIRGQVGWAFGDISAYYNGEVRKELEAEIEFTDIVARGYLDIAKMGRRNSNLFDQRSCAIELSTDQDVPLNNNLLFSVIPKQFIEDGHEFYTHLKDIGSTVKPYAWEPNKSPNEFQNEIDGIVRDWLNSQFGYGIKSL
jgi:hypothetical protein